MHSLDLSKDDGVKLKPCPFCGGDVDLVERGNLLVFLCKPESHCIGSGLGTYGLADKRETAIETWNRRRGQNLGRPMWEEDPPSEYDRLCGRENSNV